MLSWGRMLQAEQRKRDVGSCSENDKQAREGCVSVYIVGERNKISNWWLSSSGRWVLIRATRRHLPEDDNHHSHRRGNLKSYKISNCSKEIQKICIKTSSSKGIVRCVEEFKVVGSVKKQERPKSSSSSKPSRKVEGRLSVGVWESQWREWIKSSTSPIEGAWRVA
jgi:hypothetical protein